ncbi:uncharacterized protein LOC100215489 [Hydra vulgaris]|uniref:Uncharacterized protein LOC100215489 n=1 Tax=Hydra vulgaris TaxID=6087 RepID=A0ABM4DJS4_HYDVU
MRSASHHKIVRQGYIDVKIVKKSSVFSKSLNKTYLVLRSNPFALELYGNESLIDLSISHNIESVTFVEKVNSLKSHQYAFKVVIESEETEKFIFGCVSSVLQDEWINSFLEIKNSLKCGFLSFENFLQITESDFKDSINNSIFASSDERKTADSNVYKNKNCQDNSFENGVNSFILDMNDSNIFRDRSFCIDKKKKSVKNLSLSTLAINDTSDHKTVKESKKVQLEHRLGLVTSGFMNTIKCKKGLSVVSQKSLTSTSLNKLSDLPSKTGPRRSSEPLKVKLQVHNVSRGFKSFDDTLNKEESKTCAEKIAQNNLKEFQEKLRQKYYLSKKKNVFKNLRQQGFDLERGPEPPDLDRSTKPCVLSSSTKYNENLTKLTSIDDISPPVPERISCPTPINEQFCKGINSSKTNYEGVNKSLNENKVDFSPLLSPKNFLYNVMDDGSIQVVGQSIQINDEIQSIKEILPDRVDVLSLNKVNVLSGTVDGITENRRFNQVVNLQPAVCRNQPINLKSNDCMAHQKNMQSGFLNQQINLQPTDCIYQHVSLQLTGSVDQHVNLQSTNCTDQHIYVQPTTYMDQQIYFQPNKICLSQSTNLTVSNESLESVVASVCNVNISMQINNKRNFSENTVNKMTPFKCLQTDVFSNKSSKIINSLPKTFVGPTQSQFPQSKKSLFKFIDVN